MTLAEYIRRDMYIRRQVLPQIDNNLVQLLRQLLRTRIRLFGHGNQHGWLCPLGSGSQLRAFTADLNRSDITQRNRILIHGLHHTLSDLFRLRRRQYSPDDILIIKLIQYTTIGVPVHIPTNIQHLVQPYTVVLHTSRVQQDLVLLNIATDHGHLRHTARRQQTGTDRPVGDRT